LNLAPNVTQLSADQGTGRRTGHSSALASEAVGRDLVGRVEGLGANAIAFDQPTGDNPTVALIALDVEHVELADQVAENDRAITRHHSHPSTRNARSIWAAAASTSLLFPVSATLRSNSAAKSQCGRPWRQDLSRPTKRAASSNVANAIIVDVEATTAIRQAEEAAKRMIERSLERFDRSPSRLLGDLRNLGVDALDIVNLRVTGDVHAPTEGSIAEQFTALAELQRQGLIRHLGLSNVTSPQVAEAQGIAPAVCVQNHYNLVHRQDDLPIDELGRKGSPIFRSSRLVASHRFNPRLCRPWLEGLVRRPCRLRSLGCWRARPTSS
jgi:hypothetical protein